MLTFQQLILKLQSYWDAQGCALLQPYDMEVGAGTSHTATFLRAIGPEPWKAAYVQPSRRPKDGRYGENPNRMQHYYQFQVIMKPSPAVFTTCPRYWAMRARRSWSCAASTRTHVLSPIRALSWVEFSMSLKTMVMVPWSSSAGSRTLTV